MYSDSRRKAVRVCAKTLSQHSSVPIRSRGCNGIGFAGHFQTGNGPDYIILRRIYLSIGQLIAGSLQTAY